MSKIHELERLLNDEEDEPITILPNGAVVANRPASILDAYMHFGLDAPPVKKPITMRENLGGEYGVAGIVRRSHLEKGVRIIDGFEFRGVGVLSA